MYKFDSQIPINTTKLYLFLYICLAVTGRSLFPILMEPYTQSFLCPAASVSRQILASFRILAPDMRVFVPLDFIILHFEYNLALLAKLTPKRH